MERWERLLGELRAEFLLRQDELELLHSIDRQMLESERPLNATFDFIVNGTKKLLRSEHASIMLRRGSYLQPSYSASETDLEQQIDIATSLTGGCLTSGKTINIADLAEPPYDYQYVPIQGYVGDRMRSLIATPIKAHDTPVGVLSAESTRVSAFTPDHENIIAAIAAQVAIAFQRMRVFDQAALFADVDQLIFADSESPRVIQMALEKVLTALKELEHVQLTDALIAFRTGKNLENLEVVHSTKQSTIGLVLGVDESICGRAVRERQTVIVPDVREEPEYRALFGPSIQSEIAVPIVLGNDRTVIGVVNAESEETNAFQGFSQVILENFAERVRFLLAFAKLRSDVTEALEVRTADDLLVAVGDQASNMIHRINNTVGGMRYRIAELQELQESGALGSNEFLAESLNALRALAEETLQMPNEVTQVLNQQSSDVNINEAIQRALKKLRIPADVTLSLDLATDLPLLSLYSFDIVISNLLQNALDAMPAGGTLTVSTSSVIQPKLPVGYAQVVVRDTGTGIPPDILPRVFELNFSTKQSKGKGLGLGLWWCRNFIRRARGEITIASEVDVGSEVMIRIPVDRPPQITS